MEALGGVIHSGGWGRTRTTAAAMKGVGIQPLDSPVIGTAPDAQVRIFNILDR